MPGPPAGSVSGVGASSRRRSLHAGRRVSGRNRAVEVPRAASRWCRRRKRVVIMGPRAAPMHRGSAMRGGILKTRVQVASGILLVSPLFIAHCHYCYCVLCHYYCYYCYFVVLPFHSVPFRSVPFHSIPFRYYYCCCYYYYCCSLLPHSVGLAARARPDRTEAGGRRRWGRNRAAARRAAG